MCVCVYVYALACVAVYKISVQSLRYTIYRRFSLAFSREKICFFSEGKGLLWKKGTIRCVLCGKF